MRVAKRLLSVVFLAILFALPVFAQNSIVIDSKKAKQMIENKEVDLVLDVRTSQEYNGPLGHIAGSKLIPVQMLDQNLDQIAEFKDKNVLLICRSGNRSTMASNLLTENGFTQIFNVKDGMIGWKRNKFPVEK